MVKRLILEPTHLKMIEPKKSNYENTVLVGVVNDSQDEEKLSEFLEELEFLSVTAGGNVVKKFTQKINTPNPRTFIGKGKIDEILKYVKVNDVSVVVFDDELSPTQQANIERILKCKILDRTALILDIFAQRAKTSYAKTQVELAQYCLLYTSPSPRDGLLSRMPSSA